MYGYKVKIKGLPNTVFACSTTVDRYNWSNCNNMKTVEISVSKASANTEFINDKIFFHNGTHLSCVVGDDKRKSYCEDGITNEILCVAVNFEDMEFTACELSKEDAIDSAYLFPAFSTDMYLSKEIQKLLNKYIHFSISDYSYDRAKCISLWFEMVYLIDCYTRQMLCSHKRHSENYYVNKVNHVINSRYNEKIYLQEIAKEFGVSSTYLSWIYSKSTGETFRSALLAKRMGEAKKLVLTEEVTIEEIAGMVGICDEIYLRKLFKKFFGVSVTELKKINKGLTLYHEKPLKYSSEK